MKKFLTALTLVMSAGAFAGIPAPPKDISSQKTETLIIFYKPDCPYCQNMTKVLEKETGFVYLLEENFSVQRVNIMTEEGRRLADQFNVHAVPAFIRFNSVSGENSMIKGFPGIQKLASLLHLDYTVSPSVVTAVQNAQNIPAENIATWAASNAKILVGCGDGIVQAGEQCDDGNVVNGDGCSSTCQIQTGFTCVGTPSVCYTTCGDGIKAGAETCDDGNTANGDGCSSTCSTESGYNCTGSPSVCAAVCGDGIKTASESCDDGNTVNGDGCSSGCGVEAGYSCVGSPSVCVIYIPNDDCTGAVTLTGSAGTVSGNTTNASISSGTPGCVADRDLWYKFTLASPVTVQIYLNGVSMNDPYLGLFSGSCGSLALISCDDDSGPGFNSLITSSLAAGTYYIKVASFGSNHYGSFNLTYNFTGEICGNGTIGLGEECDDGNLTDGDGCSSLCRFENDAAVKGVSINRDGVRADPSSMLDVKSTESGVLIPRMSSAQRTAITSPAKGLLVFDLTTNTFWYYKTSWVEIGAAANTGFSAFNGSSQAFTNNLISAFPTEQYDDGNHFSSPNFTATETGVYKLDASTIFNVTSAAAPYVVTVMIRNASTLTEYAGNSQTVPAGFTGTIRINVSADTKITAGSPVGVVMFSTNPGPQTLTSITYSGYKVY